MRYDEIMHELYFEFPPELEVEYSALVNERSRLIEQCIILEVELKRLEQQYDLNPNKSTFNSGRSKNKLYNTIYDRIDVIESITGRYQVANKPFLYENWSTGKGVARIVKFPLQV